MCRKFPSFLFFFSTVFAITYFFVYSLRKKSKNYFVKMFVSDIRDAQRYARSRGTTSAIVQHAEEYRRGVGRRKR